MIAGKRLVVVDDSIVRGNTQRALVRMLREAGAAEVHVRISSPPVKWPCFYGIDFATPRRADRHRAQRRGDLPLDRRRLARLRHPRRPGRGDRAAQGPALPGLLRRGLPDRAAAGRAARQALLEDGARIDVRTGVDGLEVAGVGAADALTGPDAE